MASFVCGSLLANGRLVSARDVRMVEELQLCSLVVLPYSQRPRLHRHVAPMSTLSPQHLTVSSTPTQHTMADDRRHHGPG